MTYTRELVRRRARSAELTTSSERFGAYRFDAVHDDGFAIRDAQVAGAARGSLGVGTNWERSTAFRDGFDAPEAQRPQPLRHVLRLRRDDVHASVLLEELASDGFGKGAIEDATSDTAGDPKNARQRMIAGDGRDMPGERLAPDEDDIGAITVDQNGKASRS